MHGHNFRPDSQPSTKTILVSLGLCVVVGLLFLFAVISCVEVVGSWVLS